MKTRWRTYATNKHLLIASSILLAHSVFAAVNQTSIGVSDDGMTTVSEISETTNGKHGGPLIESFGNCTPAAIEQFPRSMFSMEERKQGWLAIHIVIAGYMFVCLSTLCEDYFVPAIEVLTETLEIDPDVAGATFMAAASSVPAIAASIIAILVAKGDLGVSTALGSAVLNAAGVVSVSAMFAGKVVTLHRWPMYRDSFFFLISIVVMLVAMYDDLITWFESAILIVCYLLYGIFMAFDESMELFFVEKLTFLQDRIDTSEGMFPAQASHEENQLPVATTISTKEFDPPPPGFKPNEKRVSVTPYRKSIVDLPPAVKVILDGQKRRLSLISLKRSSVVNEQILADSKLKNQVMAAVSAQSRSGSVVSEDIKIKSHLSPPENNLLRILWILYLPFTLLFFLTVPDCRSKDKRKYFVITFVMSTFHITVASYILVWMITIIGFTLHISDTVMGLTFLAIGVTLPDIVASLLVVRKGYGDMAVCNALGSNIFEILVGLGLPWLIKTAIMEPGVPILVESKGMLYSTISLLLTLVFLIVLTHWFNWKMNKLYGIILLVWYLVFLTFSSLYELGVFGNIVLPSCPIIY